MSKDDYDKKWDPVPPEPVERTCLKCDKTFIAAGRFERLCAKCTHANRAYTGLETQTFSLGGRN